MIQFWISARYGNEEQNYIFNCDDDFQLSARRPAARSAAATAAVVFPSLLPRYQHHPRRQTAERELFFYRGVGGAETGKKHGFNLRLTRAAGCHHEGTSARSLRHLSCRQRRHRPPSPPPCFSSLPPHRSRATPCPG